MQSIILEVRAGEGGEDSKLFARDMINMYVAYSNKMGFAVD